MSTSRQPNPPQGTLRRYPQWAWLFFVLFASAITAILVLTEAPIALRAVIVFAFLLAIPGWSFIRLLRIQNAITEWTLAIALSLALNTMVAMLLVYTGTWSAKTALMLLIGISIAGSLIPAQQPASGTTYGAPVPDPAKTMPGSRNPHLTQPILKREGR